jgi:hypothetical protein
MAVIEGLKPCSTQGLGLPKPALQDLPSGQNQAFGQIEASAPQQAGDDWFLEPGSVKFYADDPLPLIEGNAPDPIDVPQGVQRSHDRFGRGRGVTICHFHLGHLTRLPPLSFILLRSEDTTIDPGSE